MGDEIRISEITLVNYRQYYGTVTVRFPTEENTFAVIVGANGSGKSNFWNAIHWCLFGVEPHIKSANAPSIINMAYLYEAEKAADSKMLTTSVQIIMKSGNTKYLIRRQIQGTLGFLKRDKNNTLIMSSEDPVPYGFEVHGGNSTLFQRSEEGGRWEPLSEKHNFSSLVSGHIIPENLSHFFILDGEFLQELFDKFKNIKSGIDQISQIHVLNEALDLVEKTRFAHKIRSSRAAAGIYAEMKRIDQFLSSENYHGIVQTSTTEFIYGTDEPMHTSGRPRKADLERTIEAMGDRIHELNAEIANSDAINKTNLKEKHSEKLEEKKRIKEQLRGLVNGHLNLLITEGPFIMCRPSIASATGLIRNEMEKGKLPNIPRSMLVTDLLAKRQCLCGTRLDEGTPARRLVEDEMRRIADEVQYDIANDIRYHNDQFFKNYDGTLNRMNVEMQSIQGARMRLGKLAEEIRELQRQLPKEDKDYGLLIDERDGLSDERDAHLKDLALVEASIASRAAKKGDKVRELKAMDSQVEEERKAVLLLEKSGIISSKMREIKKEVDMTIRKKVSNETLKIFNRLSWKKNYASLMIDDKYRIRVSDEDGFENVGGMAAGEKLFLALSFIMALKRVTNYRFPFVIDSPLGKTGGNLRIRFGKHMPELLDGSQLIMLATNTEYNDNPIRPEDGGMAAPSLKKLLRENVAIQEYKIDFDRERKTAAIQRAGAA